MTDELPEFMGIYQTLEQAEADVEVLTETVMAGEWTITSVPFLGWEMVGPGAPSQKGKPPLKIVK